jgi:hypothetical protein
VGRKVIEPSSRLAERRVSFRYFGHSVFLWTAPSGVRILIDPFGNAGEPRGFPSFGTSDAQWFTESFPSVERDVVDRVRGAPSVLRGPLELGGKDFRIRGFMGKHARHFGKEFGQRNVVFFSRQRG